MFFNRPYAYREERCEPQTSVNRINPRNLVTPRLLDLYNSFLLPSNVDVVPGWLDACGLAVLTSTAVLVASYPGLAALKDHRASSC